MKKIRQIRILDLCVIWWREKQFEDERALTAETLPETGDREWVIALYVVGHKKKELTYFHSNCRRIASALAEDYVLVVLFIFLFFFSVYRIFDVPGPIFAKLCHTTRYVMK